MIGYDAAALGLDEGGDGHGDDGEEEADADSLEVSDAGLGFGGASEEGDDEVVVDRGDGDDEDDREYRERGGRDGEVAEAGVHRGGLVDRESRQLGQATVEHHRAEEHRERPHHGFHVLHFLRGARQRGSSRG